MTEQEWIAQLDALGFNDAQAAETAERADGYAHAFYEIGKMLDLPALAMSPCRAWETEMRPRLEALAAGSRDRDVAVRWANQSVSMLQDAFFPVADALRNLEAYLRDTPHHNAPEAAAARAALRVFDQARDSDEHRDGEDAERLSGEAMPARAEGIAQGSVA